MRYLLLAAFCSALLTSPTRTDAILAGYAFRDLGTLGGPTSSAVAINNLGQVIGWSATSDGSEHGFLWQNGVMADLGVFGGIGSTVRDINDHGDIAGSYQTTAGQWRGFIWSDGDLIDLQTLGGDHSAANAINNNGQVVGWSAIASGKIRAFIWQNGAMTELETGGDSPNDPVYPASAARCLNDSGMVGGDWKVAANTGGFKPAMWVDGELRVLHWMPGAVEGINSSGIAAGYVGYTSHAAIWDGDEMLDLGDFGGRYSQAFGINDSLQVTGTYWTTGGSSAFIWEGGDWITLASDSGKSGASDINNSGWIVGCTRDSLGNSRAALWVPVPEPSALSVLAGMLGTLALTRIATAIRRLALRAQQ